MYYRGAVVAEVVRVMYALRMGYVAEVIRTKVVRMLGSNTRGRGFTSLRCWTLLTKCARTAYGSAVPRSGMTESTADLHVRPWASR
jgi:hypothetical protein